MQHVGFWPPDQGLNLCPLHCIQEVLTTGPSGTLILLLKTGSLKKLLSAVSLTHIPPCPYDFHCMTLYSTVILKNAYVNVIAGLTIIA